MRENATQDSIDAIRLDASRQLDPERKSEFGQLIKEVETPLHNTGTWLDPVVAM